MFASDLIVTLRTAVIESARVHRLQYITNGSLLHANVHIPPCGNTHPNMHVP